MKENMNYEKLYKEALYHLRTVAGSRNSFVPEVYLTLNEKGIGLDRSVTVEALHREANTFIKQQNNKLDAFLIHSTEKPRKY